MGRDIYCKNCNKFVYKYGHQPSEQFRIALDLGIGSVRGTDDKNGDYLTILKEEFPKFTQIHENKIIPRLTNYNKEEKSLYDLPGAKSNDKGELMSFSYGTPFQIAYEELCLKYDYYFLRLAHKIYKHCLKEFENDSAIESIKFYGEY